jgi:hypothetical protein
MLLLSACASQSRTVASPREDYAATARKLWKTDDVGPAIAHETKWTPVGQSADHFLTPDEIDRANADVDQCIIDLSKDVEFSPSEVVRTVQLMKCMAGKGWHVSVREMLVLY